METDGCNGRMRASLVYCKLFIFPPLICIWAVPRGAVSTLAISTLWCVAKCWPPRHVCFHRSFCLRHSSAVHCTTYHTQSGYSLSKLKRKYDMWYKQGIFDHKTDFSEDMCLIDGWRNISYVGVGKCSKIHWGTAVIPNWSVYSGHCWPLESCFSQN